MDNPTGSNRLPTALELFKQYCPKFQEIELHPFKLETSVPNSSRFYFELVRAGVHLQQTGGRAPCLSFKIAKLDFSFAFNSEDQFGVIGQLTRCMADEIRTKVLAGRKFAILPLQPELTKWLCHKHPYVVKVEGEPIPGFYSGEDGGLLCAWVDFIPAHTPEWEQIRAALEYEAAHKEAVGGAIALGKEREKMDWFQKLLPPKQKPA